MKKDIKRLDSDRALLITNATLKNYLFWQKQTYKYPDSENIKNIFVWYSNLLHMLPTNYHGWRAFFRQIRFDLKFLDGLTSDAEKSLFQEVEIFNYEINALLWLPTHLYKKQK